jgi:hypothetical protein
MVVAVDYLLNHLRGDDSHACPPRLEVFDRTPDDLAPKAA